MSDETLHTIADDRLSATVSTHGAEPHSIRTPDHELLWQAGPQWPRHAPVLFPIVGRLANDTLLHESIRYPMSQHGFARDRTFRFIESDRTSCRLLLTDDARSRKSYPFAFRLELHYRIEFGTLIVRSLVSNPSQTASLPASIGAHPAFLWPLTPDANPETHEILFAEPETGPIRRVEGGLLRPHLSHPDPQPNPIQGRRLPLRHALFTDDALILQAPASTSLRYGIDGGPGLRIGWTGYRQLGIWSKPGAGFLCIEPWCGLASPQGFTGEFRDKPYLLAIAPGQTHEVAWTVTPEGFPGRAI